MSGLYLIYETVHVISVSDIRVSTWVTPEAQSMPQPER
jgi:hypothetical protein